MHFEGGIANRVLTSQITIAKGLTESRLFHLKKHVDEVALIAVLSKQIESLKTFLNVKSNFKSDQILDTCELILQEYDDMSFTAIMDCITRIKTAKPPFGDKLYESIDGRKIFEYLDIYRNHQITFLENRHLDTKQDNEFSLHQLGKNKKQSEELSKLAHSFHVDSIKKRPVEFSSDLNEVDTMVKGWIQEFDKLNQANLLEGDETLNQPGQLRIYLDEKMKEYNQNK